MYKCKWCSEEFETDIQRSVHHVLHLQLKDVEMVRLEGIEEYDLEALDF